jgi:hypothetical protein
MREPEKIRGIGKIDAMEKDSIDLFFRRGLTIDIVLVHHST